MSIVRKYKFKGTDCLGIFKDEDTERPILAFGLKKAQAIVDHVDDIKEFVTSQTPSKPEETDVPKPRRTS